MRSVISQDEKFEITLHVKKGNLWLRGYGLRGTRLFFEGVVPLAGNGCLAHCVENVVFIVFH